MNEEFVRRRNPPNVRNYLDLIRRFFWCLKLTNMLSLLAPFRGVQTHSLSWTL